MLNKEESPSVTGLQDAVLLEDSLERVRVERVVVGHHLNDSSQVGKQVALVAVCQDGRDSGVVKLDIFVVDLDKVHVEVFGDQRTESALNSSRNFALHNMVSWISHDLCSDQYIPRGRR